MPARAYGRRRGYRRRRRSIRRPRYKRRIRYRKRRMRMSRRIPTGTPYRLVRKLVYSDAQTVDVGSNSFSNHVIRANSCFDPLAAFGGHQPRYFDQHMTLYNRCYVIGSAISVRVIPSGNANAIPCEATLFLSDDSSLGSNLGQTYYNIFEQKGRKGSKVYGLQNWTYQSTGGWLRARFSAKKFFRQTNVLGNTDYACTSSADPNKVAYFVMHFSSVNGNDPGPMRLEYRMSYICVFTDPIYVGVS